MGYWYLSQILHRWWKLQIGLCRECLHGGECPGGGRIGRTLGTQYASVLALDLVGVVEKGRLSSSCLPFPYTSVGGILSA